MKASWMLWTKSHNHIDANCVQRKHWNTHWIRGSNSVSLVEIHRDVKHRQSRWHHIYPNYTNTLGSFLALSPSQWLSSVHDQRFYRCNRTADSDRHCSTLQPVAAVAVVTGVYVRLQVGVSVWSVLVTDCRVVSGSTLYINALFTASTYIHLMDLIQAGQSWRTKFVTEVCFSLRLDSFR